MCLRVCLNFSCWTQSPSTLLIYFQNRSTVSGWWCVSVCHSSTVSSGHSAVSHKARKAGGRELKWDVIFPLPCSPHSSSPYLASNYPVSCLSQGLGESFLIHCKEQRKPFILEQTFHLPMLLWIITHSRFCLENIKQSFRNIWSEKRSPVWLVLFSPNLSIFTQLFSNKWAFCLVSFILFWFLPLPQ